MSILEVTKLVNKISEFTRNASGDVSERHISVSSIIGGVIGTQLTIPSSAVKNARLYYQEQVYPVTAGYLNQINEAHPVDIDTALECAYLIWLDRYKLVHATRVDVTDMIYRLNCVTSFSNTDLDKTRIEGLSRVLSDNDVPLMNGVFLELIKQLQNTSE